MPRYLSLAAVVLGVWVIVTSDSFLAASLPALVILGSVATDLRLWTRRGRPWHDWTVIVLLLPAIASGVWITVGGLVLGVDHSDEERLLYEVGPGVALTGLLCTLISYHGRHHPDEARLRPR
jgi:hypothetical protein